jgi:hypothetical protein
MKDFVYFALVLILVSLITIQPSCLKEFSITPLGKLLFILTIVFFTMSHKLIAFLTLILFIMLNQSSREGMSNKHIDTDKNRNQFRKTHCTGKVVTKNGKPVTKKNVEKEFPNMKFENDVCNPCNVDCKFTITTSNEQMTQEDAVTPKNSKDSFVIKESLRSSKHVEPFSNNVENLTNLDEH